MFTAHSLHTHYKQEKTNNWQIIYKKKEKKNKIENGFWGKE